MLPIDPTTKNSFQRCICDGDLVIVYERHDNMKAIKVCQGSELQNRFGAFKHSDWIGKPFGSKVLSNKGGFVYLLAPTPELWTLVISHRTQILYIADISFVISYLEVVPGCVVLESGTGSGSLTTSLARAVAPSGHVYTFDFHDQRVASAREDFEKIGLNSLITVNVRDIQGEGFPDGYCGKSDSVFLDLPQPWLAIPSAGKMLKQDGILCSFSPCIEQVQQSCEEMRSSFTDIRTFEVLLRTYEVKEERLKSGVSYEGGLSDSRPCKRRQPLSSQAVNGKETTSELSNNKAPNLLEEHESDTSQCRHLQDRTKNKSELQNQSKRDEMAYLGGEIPEDAFLRWNRMNYGSRDFTSDLGSRSVQRERMERDRRGVECGATGGEGAEREEGGAGSEKERTGSGNGSVQRRE
ncbi:hypothetical protein ACLOJK_001940 [Asimina triloba]